MTEEVEIVRIEMAVVAKALARLAGARPSVLDTSKPTLVEGDRPGGLVAFTNHLLVFPHEDDERRDGEEDQPDPQDSPPGEHENQNPQCKHGEPCVAELTVDPRQSFM